MKKLLIIPILLTVIMSCSKSDNNETNIPTELFGKWQLVQYYTDISPNPGPFTNGFTIKFNTDGSFVSNEDASFLGGSFSLSASNVITLNFASSNNSLTKYKTISSVNNSILYLIKDEYTTEKYEKISNQ